MQSDFNKGASFARDLIICNIIGMQNTISDESNDGYKKLQELMDFIENVYGEYSSYFKG